jgi:predicted enzyme related to lactoylglutathione lyase
MTQRYAPGIPGWIDLGTTDVKAAVAFYGGLFGWAYEDMGPDSGGYGTFRKDGKQVAGIGPATDPERGTSWATYFATDDADGVAARVEAHDGKVIMAPMDVMDQGRMAVCTDPSGAFFSVWQAGAHTGAELVNAPGSLTWNELLTTDIEACKAFYPQVLGVTLRDVPFGEGVAYTLFEVDGRPVAGALPDHPESGAGHSRWTVYLAVADCDATYTKALELGGTSVSAPVDSPAGRLASLTDPQGGAFLVMKPNPDFSM